MQDLSTYVKYISVIHKWETRCDIVQEYTREIIYESTVDNYAMHHQKSWISGYGLIPYLLFWSLIIKSANAKRLGINYAVNWQIFSPV